MLDPFPEGSFHGIKKMKITIKMVRKQPEELAAIREMVNQAFELIATNFSCFLPDLLRETRRLGVSDEDVRQLFSHDETLIAEYCGTEDFEYQCWRNASGKSFVTRSNGVDSMHASVNELFMELELSSPEAVTESD